MDNPNTFLQKHPDIKHVEVLVPDINGILRGKRLPASQLTKLYNGELMLPRATVLLDTFGCASDQIEFGYQDGDPDRPLQAISNTLVPLPWQNPPAAQVLAEITDNNGIWFCNPTEILRHCQQQFQKLELTPVIALELEFHLLVPGSTPPVALQNKGELAGFTGPQTYNLELLADHTEFLAELHNTCEIQQISLGSALTEYGEGQFEINLQHSSDLMQACHEACLLRRLIRCVALKHQSVATFMAKPLVGNSGNGMHVHISLLDKQGNNVLASDNDELTDIMSQAIGGLLQWMPDSMAIFAPNANSYQRLDPDTFAPTQADWGHDHRGVALRLPRASAENTRIEHRMAGADACPYLVVAAILCAIQNGIERQMSAPTPTTGATVSPDALPLPHRWISALNRFSNAEDLQHALGTEFSRLYHQVKVDEEEAWHRQLNQYDHLQYLRTL